ncbi:MAG: hypothetical protein N2170_05000 [Bacteroidia bacterium]|nr:hypothetical protein [Bacteroidia bacterium]
MTETLTIALLGLKAIAFALASIVVVVWGFSVALRRKLRDILLRWEKPVFGVWTAILFVGGLAFLSGGMLGYAFYVKYGTVSEEALLWRAISSVCFGLIGLVALLYFGLRFQYIQPLSERGFYQIAYDWERLRWRVELIPWEKVYDYYVHSDDILTHFTLLLRDKREIVFTAPTHLRDIIERIIEFGTDKYTFLQNYGYRITRSSEG